MFTGPSEYAENVDNVMLYIVVISVILLVGVTTAMIYFVIKYRREKNPNPANIHGNIVLEILWVGIPTILSLSMFYYGFTTFASIRKIPKDALKIKVTARMWAWQFQYPNGKRSDTLYIPLGKPTELEMTSNDVIHSFFVPAFRIKEDVLPGGKSSYLVLEPKQPGSYVVTCAEYCGLHHSDMLTRMNVVDIGEYNQFLADKNMGVLQEPSQNANQNESPTGQQPTKQQNQVNEQQQEKPKLQNPQDQNQQNNQQQNQKQDLQQDKKNQKTNSQQPEQKQDPNKQVNQNQVQKPRPR